ncbi:MAG: hypothetical protein IPN34_09270 [Planctomycetes bacterium]|nr:hypothetical protein [Planctomycetota bacterium]
MSAWTLRVLRVFSEASPRVFHTHRCAALAVSAWLGLAALQERVLAQETDAAAIRTLARVELPGAEASSAWSQRYATLSAVRRDAEAVPALAPLRAALSRVFVHLEAIAAARGRAEPWGFAIEQLLREPVRTIEVRLEWEPAPTGVAVAALSSLRVAVGWIGVRAALPLELVAACAERGIADRDPAAERVLLTFGGADGFGAAPRLEWCSPQELWLVFGAPRASTGVRLGRPHDGAEVEIAFDLAQCEAWFANLFFGREVAPTPRARLLALQKQLLPSGVRDRLLWPASVLPPNATDGAGTRSFPRRALRSSGWLRLVMLAEQSEIALGLAALLERLQGGGGAWIEEARAWLARGAAAESAGDCTGLVATPAFAPLGLRSAIWSTRGAPSESELVASGYRRAAGLWEKDGMHLCLGSRGWAIASRGADAAAVSDELERSDERMVEGDWIGELEVATFELYSATRLALFARRAGAPEWARAWIEGLPSPRACGRLLAPSAWTFRSAPAGLVIEGEGPLGDPLLSLAELLLARAAGRAIEIWLRDLAEPEHARRTAVALEDAALELSRLWRAEPALDPRALDRAAVGPLGWRSPMDLEDAPRPAFRVAHADELPAALRAELGLRGSVGECPWVLLEEQAWFAGGTRRHFAACPGDLPIVLASSTLEGATSSGR